MLHWFHTVTAAEYLLDVIGKDNPEQGSPEHEAYLNRYSGYANFMDRLAHAYSHVKRGKEYVFADPEDVKQLIYSRLNGYIEDSLRRWTDTFEPLEKRRYPLDMTVSGQEQTEPHAFYKKLRIKLVECWAKQWYLPSVEQLPRTIKMYIKFLDDALSIYSTGTPISYNPASVLVY